MTPEELLAITPELLGKAILHRRERLAAEIPEQLDARSDELTEAASMARAAKSKRDDVNKKVASLKRERNDAQAKAKALFMEANAIQDATPRKKATQLPSQNGQRNVFNNDWTHWIFHCKPIGVRMLMSEQRSMK